MSRLFPQVRDPLELEAVRRDDGRLMPGVRAICASIGLARVAVTRFPDGSLPDGGVDLPRDGDTDSLETTP